VRAQEIEELRDYGRKLQSYSVEELEDIYFHIHVLRQPLRYNMVRREMEARRLQASKPHGITLRQGCLRDWVFSRPLLANHGIAASVDFALMLFTLTTCATLALLLPIWLFAIPFKFLGLQTAIVYMSCAPIPPILAAGFGGKLGGRGLYGAWVLAGVVAGLLLFNLTGAPAVIVESAVSHTSAGGGFSFGGGF
jgi:hypothetical protein